LKILESMDSETFREQIEAELQKMNREQKILFAWLCAVRALPFLGRRGNFYYWKKEDWQRHLYAIFRALDVCQYYLKISYNAAYANTAYDAAYDAANAAYDANAAYTPYDAANVAYAAAYAAAYDAASAASAASAAANDDDDDMQNILLKDIQNIQNGHTTFNNYLELYGAIWDNFLQALDHEHCSYWGDLYKNIFEKSFELDKEALERRMNVPTEIQTQGAAAVARYLEELEKRGAKHLNEARIIILGEKGAGKTCLARRLKDPNAPMTKDNESTAGVDTSLWKPENEDINIHLWDFAGHVVTHAVHQFFLSERCLYILVYDGRTEGRNRLEYWLNHIENYGGNSEVFILVNTRDNHIPEIPINSLKDKYPIVEDDYFSIRDDKNDLEKFRKKVIEYIKNNPSWKSLEIPSNYFNVKKELEQYFTESKKELIGINEFEKIAKRNNVDDFEGLLKNLHALGICLHYEDLKRFDTLVLNPEWISQGIYKIINWVHNNSEHSIHINDFSTVFEKDMERYPKEKHQYLFDLMKYERYGLAYETEKKGCLIIPHLLHRDRPKILSNYHFPMDETLMLRYKAEQPLPLNTISRFIVRHNEEIKKEGKEPLVWRYGVVLEDEKGSIALIREWEEERMISVSVKGKNKTAYLDKLRETLNDIFNSYRSKKPELQYRIERFGQIPDFIEKDNPLWLSEDAISNHYANGRPYYDARYNREIPMQSIVNNYNIKYFIPKGQEINIIDGKNTISLSNDLRKEIESIIPQITEIANKLSDEQEEINTDLQQIKIQLKKEQPNIPRIRFAFQTIHGILCGVAGNFITHPSSVINNIKGLIEKLAI